MKKAKANEDERSDEKNLVLREVRRGETCKEEIFC